MKRSSGLSDRPRFSRMRVHPWKDERSRARAVPLSATTIFTEQASINSPMRVHHAWPRARLPACCRLVAVCRGDPPSINIQPAQPNSEATQNFAALCPRTIPESACARITLFIDYCSRIRQASLARCYISTCNAESSRSQAPSVFANEPAHVVTPGRHFNTSSS